MIGEMDFVNWTTPLSGMVCYPGLGLARIILSTKFEVSISIFYEYMKDNIKCKKWDELGSKGVTRSHWK